ncbi:hypothetical protein EDD99_1751 [Streptomyces sp. 846.5]|nr:hypothetical protein [Streptomyces sp. 846.5]TDU03330.1 hypothetical protein EDD99_1751 [Streptomyces sp. 846.5]
MEEADKTWAGGGSAVRDGGAVDGAQFGEACQFVLVEARTAARVGAVPLRRCMTLCTLALALHRAQRPDAAHKALARARKLAPEVARVGFVGRVLELGREATRQETATS